MDSRNRRTHQERRDIGRALTAWLIVLLFIGTIPAPAGADFVAQDATSDGQATNDGQIADGWLQRITSPGSLHDSAGAVAISPNGNTAYVTGTLAVNDSNTNYATIAFDIETGDQLWMATYNGPGNGWDQPVGIVVSPDGSRVFVTGSSQAPGELFVNYATVAYNAATGNQQWVARYNGLLNLDFATAITISPNGATVYVTGGTVTTLTTESINIQYATVAYAANNGVQRWSARYGGNAQGIDVPTGIVVTPDGSRIIVTGQSDGSSGADFATVSYGSTLGNQQWVTRYNGPGTAGDWASAIDVAPSGDTVFVTGSSGRAGSGSEIRTIAYNTANGNERWNSRFEGTGSGFDSGTDVVVAPDGSGVFVTGNSQTGSNSQMRSYTTIRYDPANGNEVWTSFYDGPGDHSDMATAIAITPDGSTLYVTGNSRGIGTNNDFATIAYMTSDGQELGVSRYDGPASGSDNGIGVAARPGGGVVVVGSSPGIGTGTDIATIFYNSLNPVASITIDQADLVMSADDVAPITFTVSATQNDGQAIGVDSDGSVRWLIDNGRGGSFESNVFTPTHLAGTYTLTAIHKESGRVATTTFTIGPGAFETITIDQDGQSQLPGSGSAEFTATGRDAWGNAIGGAIDSATDVTWSIDNPVGGSFVANLLDSGSVTGVYTITAVVDASPNLVATAHYLLIDGIARYDGPASMADSPSDIATSPDGSRVFVTGSSLGVGTSTDYVTIAYDRQGDELWVKRYTGPASGHDLSTSVGVSPDGTRVYVTGRSTGVDTNYDFATIAYDAEDGEQLWVSRYDGPASAVDIATHLLVSPDGARVYVAGSSMGVDSGNDFATIAYDAITGTQLWISRYNGPGNGHDTMQGLTISPSGDTLYAAGSSMGSGNSWEKATIAYDTNNGATKWIAREGGDPPGNTQASGIVVTPDGSTVITSGHSNGFPGSTNWKYVTSAYEAATGDRIWQTLYVGGSAFSQGIAMDPHGEKVVLTGRDWEQMTSNDAMTVAYSVENGSELWTNRYNGAANGNDGGNKVVFSADGSQVFVAGYTTDPETLNDFLLLAIDRETGETDWLTTYDGVGNGNDNAVALSVSPDGRGLFVTGQSMGDGTSNDFATLFINPVTPPFSLGIDPPGLGVPAGDDEPVVFTVEALDAAGRPTPIDADTEVVWSISDPAGGSFDGNILTPGTTKGTYAVTATWIQHSSVTGSTDLVLYGELVSISIDQTDLVITADDSDPIELTASGADDDGNTFQLDNTDGVDWTINEPLGGSLNDNLLTPGTTAGTYTITAMSTDDPSIMDTMTFTIVPGDIVTIQIEPGDVMRDADTPDPIVYQATGIDGHGNTIPLSDGVTWGFNGGPGGTFDGNTLTPGTVAGTYTISAMLDADPDVSQTAILTILPGAIAEITIDQRNLQRATASTSPLTYTASAVDTHGNQVGLVSDIDVAWSIDDPAGGNFTDNVLTTGIIEGNYTITATLFEDPLISDETLLRLIEAAIAPVNVVATAGPKSGEISVTWDPPPAVADGVAVLGYNVYGSDTLEGPHMLIGSVGSDIFGFVESGLDEGDTRSYVIHAIFETGEGPPSEDEAVATAFAIRAFHIHQARSSTMASPLDPFSYGLIVYNLGETVETFTALVDAPPGVNATVSGEASVVVQPGASHRWAIRAEVTEPTPLTTVTATVESSFGTKSRTHSVTVPLWVQHELDDGEGPYLAHEDVSGKLRLSWANGVGIPDTNVRVTVTGQSTTDLVTTDANGEAVFTMPKDGLLWKGGEHIGRLQVQYDGYNAYGGTSFRVIGLPF